MNIFNRLLARSEGVFDDLNIPRTETDGQIEAVVSFFFIIAGIISVIMIIIGGYWYVLSGGDPQKVKKAKDTILYAAVGLVISLMAWTIINFVLART
jgi:hypothetical protein